MEVVYEATGEKLKIPFRRIHLTDEDAQSTCRDLLSSQCSDFGSTARQEASDILRYRSGLVFVENQNPNQPLKKQYQNHALGISAPRQLPRWSFTDP